MPHIHELIDFCVDAFIVYQNKVLLIFHKKHQMWLPVGGHIELHEDPEQALLREVKEECGLEIEILSKTRDYVNKEGITLLPVPDFMDIHLVPGTQNHRHISLRYLAKAKSDQFVHNQIEHDQIRWFTERDLEDSTFNIHPNIRFYAKAALEAVQ